MALEPLDDLPTSTKSRSAQTSNRIIVSLLGLLLLFPAMLCCGSTLLIPTIQTVSLSQQKNSLVSKQTQYVGMDNYNRLFQDKVFASAMNFSASLALERFLVVAIVPLLLALALSQFGLFVRIPIRLLFTVPLAFFAPVLALLSWRLAMNPVSGLFQTGDSPPLLASPATAQATLTTIDALSTFALACGLGLVIYLVALRGTGSQTPKSRRLLTPLVVSWLVSIFAAVAYALQAFSLVYVLTAGGPGNSTMNLEMYQFRNSFVAFNFGFGASVSTVTLVILGTLGLIAGVIIIATGLRLETVPWRKSSSLIQGQSKIIIGILLALGVIGALVVSFYAILPTLWVWRTAQAAPDIPTSILETISPARMWANTILPPATAIFLQQLPIIYLAALGIGALRPLGRFSEWLLLPFSPWFFVTMAPLSLAAFQNLRTVGLVNTPTALQVAPSMINVVMLFVMTLFFKGQTHKWQATRVSNQPTVVSFLRTVILPSLPLALLLAGVAVAVSQQDLLWPLISVNQRDLWTIPVSLAALSNQFATQSTQVGAVIASYGIPQFIVSFVILAVFQIFYLDRLALGAGKFDADVVEASVPTNDKAEL